MPLSDFAAPAQRARRTRLPDDGLVVLMLELRQQLSEQAAMGAGKGAQRVAPMHASVRPWQDGDSVRMWSSNGAQVGSDAMGGSPAGSSSTSGGAAGSVRGAPLEQQQQGQAQGEQTTLDVQNIIQAVLQQLLDASRGATEGGAQNGSA